MRRAFQNLLEIFAELFGFLMLLPSLIGVYCAMAVSFAILAVGFVIGAVCMSPVWLGVWVWERLRRRSHSSIAPAAPQPDRLPPR